MTYPATNFDEAVVISIQTANQMHQVINGASDETVSTDSGEIPSLRKALTDNFYFIAAIPWAQGSSETVFNQLREESGNWYYAPTATADNPVAMGASPAGDDNWRIFSFSSGVIPTYSPREVGDGTTTTFDTPVTEQTDANYFIVTVDGVKQTPLINFTINSSGKLVFTSAPDFGTKIDIMYLSSVTLDSSSVNLKHSGSTATDLKVQTAPVDPWDVARKEDLDNMLVDPVVQGEHIADGTTTTFDTPATSQVSPNAFFVFIDAAYQKPTTSYSVNSSGQIVFTSAPPENAIIDITYFTPITIDRRVIGLQQSGSVADDLQVAKTPVNSWDVIRKADTDVIEGKVLEVSKSISFVAGGKIWPEDGSSLPLGSQTSVVSTPSSILNVAGVQVRHWVPSGALPSAPFTITNIVTNDLGGYNVEIDSNTYEFVTKQVAQWRGQSFFYNDFTVDIRGWGARPSKSASANSDSINAALNYLISRGGGAITSSNEEYPFLGATVSHPAENITFFGAGWETHWRNDSVDGTDALLFTGSDFTSPVKGITLRDMRVSGNPSSGVGLKFDKLGRFQEDANVTSVYRCKIDSHGGRGVQFGATTVSGGGNKLVIESSLIDSNGAEGIAVLGQSNLASLNSNTITNNTTDGISLNQVSSTNGISYNFIADNGRFGVYAFRCEQPIITFNGFNRNSSGAVVLGGDPEGSSSVKYTESALIMGNLFGDNGGGSTSGSRTEITIRAARGTMVYCNYFYNTGKDRYIYISDYAEGYMIRSNWFKDFDTETEDAKKYVVKSGAVNSFGVFEDDIDNSSQWTTYLTNKSKQYIVGRNETLYQTKESVVDTVSYLVKGDGTQEFGDGTNPADVSVGRTSAGTYTIDGILAAGNTIVIEESTGTVTPRSAGPRVYYKTSPDEIRVVWPDGTDQLWLAKS